MSKTRPIILITNRAWVPSEYATSKLLADYSYKVTVREQDEEDGQWYEREHTIELPKWNGAGTHLGFPRGDMDKLLSHFHKPILIDKRSIAPLGFDLELADHVKEDPRWIDQEKLLKAWFLKRGGVVKAPAASGKSVLGIAIICKLGLRTICMFERKDFRDQWLNELYTHTDLKDIERAIGKPQAGIFTGHEFWPITFATFQQLYSKTSREALKGAQDYFGLEIVDEAHHTTAPSYRNRVSFFNPVAFLGVTATPFRKDKLESIYFDFIGPIAIEGGQEQLKPLVRLMPTGFTVRPNPWGQEWAQWNTFLSQICKNKERNKMICKNVIKDVELGRCVLIVSDRVKHCFDLESMLKQMGMAPSRIAVVVGSTGTRKTIYKKVNEGKYDVLIASKVIDEGVNITRLDTLHLATPVASKPRTEQRVGRIRRPAKGKPQPWVYDYVDRGHGMIYGSSRSREIVYGNIGATVKQAGGAQIHNESGLPMYYRKNSKHRNKRKAEF